MPKILITITYVPASEAVEGMPRWFCTMNLPTRERTGWVERIEDVLYLLIPEWLKDLTPDEIPE